MLIAHCKDGNGRAHCYLLERGLQGDVAVHFGSCTGELKGVADMRLCERLGTFDIEVLERAFKEVSKKLGSYHPTSRNCNDFAEHMSAHLGKKASFAWANCRCD
jgi:hypothetical protein